MDGKAGGLFIVAIMGGLCALFVFMLIRTFRRKATGVKNIWRIFRMVVFAICAIWFAYVLINLLLILPEILAS